MPARGNCGGPRIPVTTRLRGPKAADNAAKLLRVFREQLQALQRYRGKGQQKVTVEHVHVHAGGQAIGGCVEAPRGRGERG